MKIGVFGQVAGLIIGGLCIVGGILVLVMFPGLMRKEIDKEFHIGFGENGSYNELTQRWIEPPYNMSLQIWTFSIVNSFDVISNGTYPKFYEKGPYTFALHERKNNVKFFENDTMVLYRNKYTYYFDPELSCNNCRLTDRVVIPNPIFQLVADFAKRGSIFKPIVQYFIDRFQETLFVNVTVAEMTFDGFESSLLHGICSKPLIAPICKAAKIPSKIGFFYKQNGTDDGEFLVDTGLLDSRNLGRVLKYNGWSSLPSSYWYSEQARTINGSEQLFSPGLDNSKRLYIFLGQLKRSVFLEYKEKINVAGVPAWRYIMPSELYDPLLPENRGFCNPNTSVYFDNITQPAGCLPKGFLDIGSIQPGKPRIYLSGSHFYYSPSAVYENFYGFTPPSMSNDETVFDIEPITGVVLRVNERSQINVGMLSGDLKPTKKIPNMVVPVLWFNETVYFDSQTRNELLNSLVGPKNKVSILGYMLLGTGCVLSLVAVILIVVLRIRKDVHEDEERLVGPDPEDEDRGGNSLDNPSLLPDVPPTVIEPPERTS